MENKEEIKKEEIKPVDPQKIEIVKKHLKEVGIILSNESYESITRAVDEKVIPEFNGLVAKE